jgi:hypothetical protein
VIRLRAEQAGLRKSILRVYHIQREQFLPSAKAMITTIVVVILALLLVTKLGGLTESLITLGFLSFFFLYLLRLLNVIDTPFKVGQERTDDDVSLFLLTEFMVYAQAAGTAAVVAPEDVEAQAAAIEEQLVEVEEAQAAAIEEQLVEVEEAQAAELEEAAEAEEEATTAGDKLAQPDA